MSNVRVVQMPVFKRAYKKLHRNQKAAINKAIAAVVADPSSGEEKRGDLAGILIYKFDCINQQFLLAYEYDPETRTLHAWMESGRVKCVPGVYHYGCIGNRSGSEHESPDGIQECQAMGTAWIPLHSAAAGEPSRLFTIIQPRRTD